MTEEFYVEVDSLEEAVENIRIDLGISHIK